MGRTLKALLLSCVLSAASVSAVLSAEPVVMTCSAEKPTVALGETLRLSARASAPPERPARYAWEATAGRLEGEGAEVRWDLTNVRPGTYAVSVRVESAAGASPECLLRVVVRRDPGSRGPLLRETGSSLLVAGQRESPGYGLYSYLLLGSPPSEAARERYIKVIETLWGLLPEIVSLEQYVQRQSLNVAYLPVTSPPAGAASAEWVLANYDYARARAVLRLLSGTNREGPYIVSAMRPMSEAQAAPASPGPYLFQDLSRVPPHLAVTWVREFLNQAAQERFWEERTGQQLALKLRLTIGILGVGLPEVRKALDTWIAWVR
jgi:hypothetical protein